MKYASVCSGIEAASVAWKDLGWKAQWLSEIEPFPCKVLKHHYPSVPNLGDMTKLKENTTFNETTIDLLVGGTPCQSFSLAGLRGGMADERGNLALIFCKLLLTKQPKWFCWENVPGVFSSFTDEEESKKTVVDGRTKDLFGDAGTGGERGVYEECWQTADFATLLEGFRECGYSVCYRVLDSQYFGVPQRRRRVFVVGHLGNDWRPPFAVLFEPESLRRDITPGKEKRKATTGNTRKGVETKGYRMQAFGEYEDDKTASSLKQRDFKDATDLVCTASSIYGIDEECNISENKFGPLLKGGEGGTRQAVGYILHGSDGTTSTATETDTALSLRARPPGMIENSSTTIIAQQCSSITANGDAHSGFRDENGIVIQNLTIRRLTPTECARLQGFPDDYLSSVPGATDTVMYKAFGNSMTVNVMKWIGERIDKVDAILNRHKNLNG